VAQVTLQNLQKSYGSQVVLHIDDLEIRDGEFFSLLGPSGCGKTTTLRCIAGLAQMDRGNILIGGRDVTAVPTWQRNLGMVFQKYALFPHLTVGENVGYGLRERGAGRDEIARKVAGALALVALPDTEYRLPHQLSGGQQQRVAMARAIVYQPDVLLLDEPLSNLDVKLRVAMRVELKRLQRTLGVTTIFVTHDQQEALALSDRIAVMRDGLVEQLGTPEDIYDRPSSIFVADFVGATNLLTGVVVGPAEGGTVAIDIDSAGTVRANHGERLAPGQKVSVTIKPERVQPVGPTDGDGLIGEIDSVAYLGSAHSYLIRVGSQRLEMRRPLAMTRDQRPAQPGDRITIAFELDAVRIFSS
jgi:ABC-type Fe3+/spermidine/putrescine transport system ATPase subunit